MMGTQVIGRAFARALRQEIAGNLVYSIFIYAEIS